MELLLIGALCAIFPRLGCKPLAFDFCYEKCSAAHEQAWTRPQPAADCYGTVLRRSIFGQRNCDIMNQRVSVLE
jgi:hypothetical protein